MNHTSLLMAGASLIALIAQALMGAAMLHFFTPTAAGTRHTLPAAAASLIDIPRNAAGRKRAITKVDQGLLDATVRDWQGMTHHYRDPEA